MAHPRPDRAAPKGKFVVWVEGEDIDGQVAEFTTVAEAQSAVACVLKEQPEVAEGYDTITVYDDKGWPKYWVTRR